MLRSPIRHPKAPHQMMANSPEKSWPDDTIVVLPETPRVRLSPRRKMQPYTPGWPTNHIGETIRMYQDPVNEDETTNFAMNPEFMQTFIPPLSPTKVRMLSPSRRDVEPSLLEDDVIEIPDSAGLSEETRNAIYNVWINDDDLDGDNGYMEGIHYLKDCQATQYKQRNAKLNLTIRYLVKQLQEKEQEISRIPLLERKLINLQTQLKSLALIPMTPIRTSSLKHNLPPDTPRTPRSPSSKENIPARSKSASPRKPLQPLSAGNIQPSDLVRQDSTDDLVSRSKRILHSLHQDNQQLKSRVSALELANANLASENRSKIDALQLELEKLVSENHRLEGQLQTAKAEASNALTSPVRATNDNELARLSEELAWHAKLHLYAEKERLRLLDLLEFAGREGKVVVKEYVGLKEKLSKISLRKAE